MNGRRMRGESPWLVDGYVGVCGHCGKRSFNTRKAAKLYGRREYPGSKLQAYKCRRGSDAFHVGHIAAEIKSGEIPKHLFYGPRGVGRVREKQGTRIVRKKAA
ncbi:hypothetical protein [Nocardia asiatica]|uniref:hypothetical protein n=1 Tax=Nocardia asiatica TaxID=209252 RepID=UPI002453CF66|nr:hypothetical protein [Nocardia asiatica]